MSYLYRSGNGRNNIAYTTTVNSSTKYLRRTGTGRTNITWTTIPQGSTYNILNRTGTGRNNIAWGNLYVPVPYPQEIQPNYTGDVKFGCYLYDCVRDPYWKYNGNNFFYTPFGIVGDSNYSAVTQTCKGLSGTYWHQDVRTGGTLTIQWLYDWSVYSGSFDGNDKLFNLTFKMGNYWLSINIEKWASGSNQGSDGDKRITCRNFTITAVGRNYSSIGSQSGQMWATYLE